MNDARPDLEPTHTHTHTHTHANRPTLPCFFSLYCSRGGRGGGDGMLGPALSWRTSVSEEEKEKEHKKKRIVRKQGNGLEVLEKNGWTDLCNVMLRSISIEFLFCYAASAASLFCCWPLEIKSFWNTFLDRFPSAIPWPQHVWVTTHQPIGSPCVGRDPPNTGRPGTFSLGGRDPRPPQGVGVATQNELGKPRSTSGSTTRRGSRPRTSWGNNPSIGVVTPELGHYSVSVGVVTRDPWAEWVATPNESGVWRSSLGVTTHRVSSRQHEPVGAIQRSTDETGRS